MSNIRGMLNCHPIPDTAEPLFDIERIEKYFEGKSLPETVKLDEITTITNVAKFVKGHLNYLRGNEHKPIFYVYYWRLQKLTHLLKTT